MIKIVAGKSKFLREIAEEYFKLLNPQNKNGAFHKRNSIYGRIETQFKIKSNRSNYSHYGRHLYNNLKTLITGIPSEIYQIQKQLDGISNLYSLKRNILLKRINKIFYYDTFRESDTAIWLAKEINLGVCVYCNRQYISIIKHKKSHMYLADFDHYFLRSKYPCLSLSFYNLILSCHGCNSKLKFTAKFILKNYLHPYMDSFNDILRFSTNVLNTNFFFNKGDDFEIKLKKNWFKNPTKKDINRAFKTAEIFRIKDLYNLHKDVIIELIQKHIIYSPQYIDNLYSEFSILFSTKADVYRMLLGAYVIDSEINKRPLSKFIKDISEEFGFLKLH
ncbi:MAG: hypothetical protein EHM58_00060 [Ignavibacteriae bacterium]|nr:MAG: hypothetical protein EHM58_00060 [Ignavibacteriota bacterium]